MTYKEELEILRGEPIHVFAGDPLDIPCIETSDPERLCKHPVVSVNMITYNHEPYIRQAIKGVMMQKTDFEFELVIGEDCSTDKTREICFEYQRRFPDKIRVLWCDHNLYRNPHPAGGNGERNLAHCRGEFVAWCEGDDYWIDPLKLQKQVDVMRKHGNVSFCFCGSNVLLQWTGELIEWKCDAYQQGIIKGKKFAVYNIFGRDPSRGAGSEGFVMTATVMYRRENFDNMTMGLEVFRWRLPVGDTQISIANGLIGDVYYLPDVVSVYRRTKTGAMGSDGDRVCRDSNIVRMFFALNNLDFSFGDLPTGIKSLVAGYVNRLYCNDCLCLGSSFYRYVFRNVTILRKFFGIRFLPLVFTMPIGKRIRFVSRIAWLWALRLCPIVYSCKVKKLYAEIENE